MKKHLAILTKEEIEKIFSGEKRVDVKFSKKRVIPYAEVSPGDLVYFKSPNAEIVGQYKVKKVFFLGGIEDSDLDFFEKKFGIIFPKKEIKKYLTVIFLDEVEKFITSPIKIDRKSQKKWIILDN